MNEFETITPVTNETGLMTMQEDERFIMDLTAERKVQFCSMVPKNEDEEIILFNAMNKKNSIFLSKNDKNNYIQKIVWCYLSSISDI